MGMPPRNGGYFKGARRRAPCPYSISQRKTPSQRPGAYLFNYRGIAPNSGMCCYPEQGDSVSRAVREQRTVGANHVTRDNVTHLSAVRVINKRTIFRSAIGGLLYKHTGSLVDRKEHVNYSLIENVVTRCRQDKPVPVSL